jgi:osmotically-inducible protein OsmY
MMHKLLAVFFALFLMQAVCLAKDPKVLTDDAITDQVRIKLAGDPIVKGGHLDVKVEKGVATISGAVDQQNQKDKAGAIARKVKGVKQVVNEIVIKSRTPGK